MNRLGLKNFFSLTAKYFVSMNINVLLIYQAFKRKFGKEEVATQLKPFSESSTFLMFYMKQLVTVKCYISIYIFEKGVVKFGPLESQEVYETML